MTNASQTHPPLKKPNATLALLALSYLMMTADGSIVTTALPKIHANLHFTNASLSWVQSAYLIAGGGMLFLGARVGDYIGRRKMFMWGLSIFMLASLAAGIATSAVWLIAARFGQGLAAAFLAPSTLALLSTSFPVNPARARALAIYSSITGIGTAVGLVVGGFITSAFSWHWAFLINLPLGSGLLLAAPKHLCETTPHRGKIDFLGAFLSTLGMLSLIYGIIQSAAQGWTRTGGYLPIIGGIVLLVSFYLYEDHAQHPIVPLHLLKDKVRSGANGARFLFVGAMGGFWFFIAQYLEDTRHFSPLMTGLGFLPMTLASFAVAFFVPRLSARFGDSVFLLGGLATVGAGTLWLSFLGSTSNYLLSIALPMLFVGLGQGASTMRLTTAAIAGVSPRDAGAASAVVTTAVQLGGALGLSLLVALAATASSHHSTAVVMTERAHVGLLGGAGMIALALALVLAVVVPRHSNKPVPSGTK